LLDVILLVFDGLKSEVAVAGQEATLLFFPKCDELLDRLQDEATLVIGEFTVLTETINAYNVALLLGKVCLLDEVIPDLLFAFEGDAVALRLILGLLLILFPLSTGLFLLLTCLVEVLNVSHGLL